MKSWKTTSTGVAMIAGAVVGIYFSIRRGQPLTEEGVTAAVTAILGGVGLVMARDNDKSSEQVGAGSPPIREGTSVPANIKDNENK